LILLVLLTGCGETPGDVLPNPRDGRSGLQLAGQAGGRQIVVNDGLPVLNASDCDVNEGPDRDLCILTRDINGQAFRLIIENPGVLEEGADLPIRDVPCDDPLDCDEVTDAVIVDVQFGTDERQRAVSGRMTIEVVVPQTRYRGALDLRLPDGGNLTGRFDLVPRPEEISAR
jgi:hypothetical protein